MSEPKYTGFGSRIVLDTLKPSKIEPKETSQSTNKKSRDPINVDMRFFTVKVKPTGDSMVQVEEDLEKCFGQGFTVESRPSPTNTTSDESFHSCRSTNSQPDVREEGKGRRETSGSRPTGRRTNHSQDGEFFNQLTMVNAIFLNNTVGQCVHEETRYAQGDKSHHRKSSVSTSHAKCQGKFGEDQAFMHNFSGDNVRMQRHFHNDNFAYFSGDNPSRESQWNHEVNTFKSFNNQGVKRVNSETRINSDDSENSSDKNVKFESSSKNTTTHVTESVPKSKHESVSNTERSLETRTKLKSSSKNQTINATELVHERKLEPFLSSEKSLEKSVKHESSCKNQATNITALVPKSKLEPVLKSQETELLVPSANNKCKSLMEMRKEVVNNGESLRFVETYFLKQSFVEQLPELDIINRTIAEKLKEGDCLDLDKSRKVKTLKRLERVDKGVLIKNLRLGKDRKMKSSIAKIVIPPLRPDAKWDKDDFISSTNSVIRNSANHNLGDSENLDAEERDKSLVLKEPLTVCRSPLTERNISMNERTDVVYMRENLSAVERRSRRACRLSCPLPVIREESSESLESNSSEESNATEDYCLVDSQGRTIHLFDDKGLPLTDECGRPLRDADGQTLLRCDSQGVPLVDASTAVFDHLGRHALDPQFSPWSSAPVPPSRRLCAPSGRPLMLFDSCGRPLTAANGALLQDSAGNPLLKLNV